MRSLLLASVCAVATAAPACAQLRAVPSQPASEREALRGVEVYLVNEGVEPVAAEGPRQLELTAADGTRLVLERLPAPDATVPPGGFVKRRYVPVGIAGRAVPPADAHGPAPMPVAAGAETIVPSATGSSAAFFDRFRPHEPVYGVFGLQDSGGKIQVSFAFQPFAEAAPLKLGRLRFAYTQTMFWALDVASGPFRATTYSPEVFADVPVSEDAGVAIGFRHDSNGRGNPGSLDVNRFYLRAHKSFDLGNDWRLDVAPQAWAYVGSKGAAPGIERYWGYTALTAAIGQEDGLKLSITGRGSFETGRGAAELFLSYPVARLGAGAGFYVFGQAFTGHGEALDDYRVRDTHARIGIAFTR